MKQHMLISCTMTLLASAIGASLSSAQAAEITGATVGQVQSAVTSTAQSDENRTAQQKRREAKEAAKNATNLSTVTVAPLRASLQSAQTIKQNSRMVVDSIVAEDIGKLPDNSVADALQRVTGVQISQGVTGETTGVTIRGLPNVVTTLDGREFFNAFGRQFSFQDLPATAVAGLDVYKTSEASMISGGIAGTVNIRTFKPFDFKGFKLAGSYTATYSDRAGRVDPTASLLLSNRWNTGIGEIGALANFSLTTLNYDIPSNYADNNAVYFNGSGGNGQQPFRLPNGDLLSVPQTFGATYNRGYRERPEFNYALQWKINDSTEAYAQGMYTWVHDNYTQTYYQAQPRNAGIAPTSYTLSGFCSPIKNQTSAFLGQTICAPSSLSYTGNYFASTSTQALQERGQNVTNSIGIKWHGSDLSLSADVTRVSSSYQTDNTILDQYITTPIDFSWTAPNSWSLGSAASNPNDYYLGGYFPRRNNNKANQTASSIDGSWDMGNGFFNSLDFGVRYSNKSASASGGFENLTTNYGSDNPPASLNTIALFGPSFECVLPSTPVIAGGAISACRNQLLNNAGAIATILGGARWPGNNLGQFFNINEKTTSAYAQLNYGGELFGLPYDGLVGMRIEKTDRDLSAYLYNTNTAVYTPTSKKTSGNNYLPNVSFNLHILDDLQLRLDAAKTVTFPDFASLNPTLTLTPPSVNSPASGAGGNPNLSPIRSQNFDASLEWYFSPVGSLTAGAFYRQINGYILNFVNTRTINGIAYNINQPISAGSGHLDGIETAYTQFFDFLPGAWGGLGFQANYTYIAGSTRAPAYFQGPVVTQPLQNVSKNNYNAVLMYEKYGISARLAYGVRSNYAVGGVASYNVYSPGLLKYDVPPKTLDFSIGYDVNKHLTVVLTATNLLKSKETSYDGYTVLADGLTYLDRTVGLGVRLKL